MEPENIIFLRLGCCNSMKNSIEPRFLDVMDTKNSSFQLVRQCSSAAISLFSAGLHHSDGAQGRLSNTLPKLCQLSRGLGNVLLHTEEPTLND